LNKNFFKPLDGEVLVLDGKVLVLDGKVLVLDGKVLVLDGEACGMRYRHFALPNVASQIRPFVQAVQRLGSSKLDYQKNIKFAYHEVSSLI
jgi:hypothetical protein